MSAAGFRRTASGHPSRCGPVRSDDHTPPGDHRRRESRRPHLAGLRVPVCSRRSNLKSQIATSSSGRGARRKPPFAFTEHGAVISAGVLNTPVAVAASIHVVRVFVRLREMLAHHEEFARKLQELEAKCAERDRKFLVIFEAIRQLMTPPAPKKAAGLVSWRSPHPEIRRRTAACGSTTPGRSRDPEIIPAPESARLPSVRRLW